MKLFKVSLIFNINLSGLYKMKQYLTYILIGLAIAIVIGLGYYVKKRIDTLEEQVRAVNAEMFTVRNYMSSEKRLANDDMFSANTQRNISLEIKENSNVHPTSMASNTIPGNNVPVQQEVDNKSPQENGNTSSNNSVERLNDEISGLRGEISNIEDLIQDSSYASSHSGSVDINAAEYEQQLQNINTVNDNIDDNLIQQVEQVKEYTQQVSGSQADDYQKNNNSEFEDLANVDLEHNSEFDELLDNSEDVQEENVQGDEEEQDEDKQSSQQLLDGQSVNESEEFETELELPNELKKEVDIEVISNLYTKKQLENLCINNSLSKSGNKNTLVQRLLDNNVELAETENELSTINSS